MQQVSSRGYLLEKYRLFHSRDQRDVDFQPHYHDFHKIIYCLGGRVTYRVEGTICRLGAGEGLIIPQHQIHASTLESGEVYDRMVLWISDDFVRSYREDALEAVFRWPLTRPIGLFGPSEGSRAAMLDRLLEVEKNQHADFSGHTLLTDTYLLQFLLMLSRELSENTVPQETVSTDPRFRDILAFINLHLGEDLSIERLAGTFFMSPSYLMHAFRKNAGCTVHQYVIQKRLIRASSAIRSGTPVGEAAQEAGFSDYSVFLKAFRREYGCAPRDIRQT